MMILRLRACILFWLTPFLLSASASRATTPALDPPNQPDLVTVVPFQLYYGFILLSAEVDGHRGTFLLDTGSPRIFLNSQYLRRGYTGGIDTSAASTPPTGSAGEVTVHTLRIGTLVIQLDTADIGPPDPQSPTNASIMDDKRMLQFGQPVLGFLGLPAMAPFETIIDYAHRRLMFIRLDTAGHRVTTVPQFTPRMTVPLVPEPGVELAPGVMLGKGNGWSIVGRLGEMPDTLMVDTGSPNNSITGVTRQKLVAHLTPAGADMTRQFKEVYTRMAKLQGIQAPPQPSLWIVNHLMVAGHAFDALPFAEDYVEDLLGYPFLSQGGAIGFNIRAHQLIFYR